MLNVFGAGGVDTAFSGAVYTSSAEVTDAAVQTDGKIVLAGNFSVVNAAVRTRVARFNTDGTLDAAFNPPEMTGGSGPTSIAIQPDGKIIIGGDFSVAGSTRKFVIRLNPNGSLDESFADLSPQFSFSYQIIDNILIRPDGKILISGRSLSMNGRAGNMQRLNADGSFDPTFFISEFGALYDAALMPDGKIVANGDNGTWRFNSDGSRDAAFPALNASGGASTVEITESEALPDGKLLIGGDFTSINGMPARNIARILPDGSVDSTFNAGGAGPNARLYDVSTASDGKIYISGEFTQYNGVARSRLARLNADGSLDASFNYTLPAEYVFVKKTVGLSDGKVLIMGTSVGGSGVSLIRLNADGSPDPTFRAYAGAAGSVRDIVRQPDGKYVVGGEFNRVNGLIRRNIARLNADGSVDPTFDCPIFNNTSGAVTKIVIQTDGKILFTLLNYPGSIRLNTDGSYDPTYVPPPIVNGHDIDLFPNGQILVDGYYKLNADGSLDASFNPPNQAANSVLVLSAVIQSDGKIVIGGVFGQLGTSRNVARLNPNGSVDATFNTPGGANNRVADLDVQPDGKVLIAGDFTSVNSNNARKYLARLNPDGSLDASFAPVVNAPLSSVKIQPDGKILISGDLTAVNGIQRKGYARLNADGSLDMSFNIGSGANSKVWRIGLQPDNKVLIAGDFTKIAGFTTIGAARLDAVSAKTPFDYDGDGKADVSVFRASENKWYILRSSDFGITQTVFAVAGDVPVPADYDGDGKTDVAVFRPSNGAWWYLSSISNAQINVNFGQAGDIPRPSDFDGDGKTDFVLYRPSNSVWYRFSATGQTSVLAFGIAEDKPVVGDFDGDGKSDPAVFRPSTGDWWYAASGSGGQFLAVHWGAAGDVPAPADYDGDGKTDFAIFRPSDGGWFVSRSSNGTFISTSFGTAGDKPIPADYDGDGKADIAVFRPSTGIWYLLQTTSGFGAVQWGIAADAPTENAFVP
ncbi:MAG: VCBS repeat-containing protein [Acidobacteria bacterium]|nr:VCBS repeat-containing protein [Acidobacteriota bacterium]